MTALRVIETEVDMRLVMYSLESGEQYFMESQDEAPETVGSVEGEDVILHPYSLLSAYDSVKTPLIFLTKGGMTVKQGKAKVHLLKKVLPGDIPPHPLPLVEKADVALIQQLSDDIRLIASQRRLLALNDFPGVVRALNSAIDDTTDQADMAIRIADESLGFLLENLQTLSVDDPLYSEIRKTSVEQMRLKLESYNKLMRLIDKLLLQKQEIEEMTHELQKQIRPIKMIAEDLPYIS